MYKKIITIIALSTGLSYAAYATEGKTEMNEVHAIPAMFSPGAMCAKACQNKYKNNLEQERDCVKKCTGG